ncbi:hypothetical protein ABMA27_001345 [Loxostege sticticalis]|uniref:FLYWCH-type domain-containing protein n=1 Tax=Loxostege sticticalis TaxID=481309 RepID=A0ABR3HYA9_LOXSC
MINGYTFSKLSTYSKTWLCSNRFSYKCEAKIKMDGLERVTESHLNHNHSPPQYYVSPDGKYVKIRCEFKIIDSPKGGRLIMINGYTFSKLSTNSKTWLCSNRFSYKCEAKIKMDGLERVTESHLNHNHSPPQYYVSPDGKYVKIR